MAGCAGRCRGAVSVRDEHATRSHRLTHLVVREEACIQGANPPSDARRIAFNDQRETEHAHHQECKDNHDDDRIIGRTQPEKSIGEFRGPGSIERHVLIEAHDQAAQESAHHQDLGAGGRRKIGLALVRSAQKNGDQEYDRDANRRDQAKESKVVVHK
eukprot:4430367-Prymnesium_polylepis.1